MKFNLANEVSYRARLAARYLERPKIRSGGEITGKLWLSPSFPLKNS